MTISGFNSNGFNTGFSFLPEESNPLSETHKRKRDRNDIDEVSIKKLTRHEESTLDISIRSIVESYMADCDFTSRNAGPSQAGFASIGVQQLKRKLRSLNDIRATLSPEDLQSLANDCIEQVRYLGRFITYPSNKKILLDFLYELKGFVDAAPIDDDIASTRRKIDREIISLDLERWKADPNARGNKNEAADLIMEAFDLSETVLIINNCQINLLPDCIGLLSDLRELDLEDNEIEELPPAIDKLTISELYLANNRIKVIPPSIGNLTNLKILNLRSNQIDEIPPSIGNLTKLQSLVLHGNYICDERGNQIKVLPPSLGNLINLTHLDLGKNRIEEIPPFIGILTKLQSLDLHGNHIKILPPTFGNLINLTYLNLEDNQIDELPPSIGNLIALDYLDISHNQIEELPFIGNLTRLTRLIMHNNCLKELPSFIGNFGSLNRIEVQENPDLCTVPMSLGNCHWLTDLDITGTGISEDQLEVILQLCQLARAANAREELPDRLKGWTQYAKSQHDLSKIMEFTDQEIGDINEWLVRLQKTKDFRSANQTQLAMYVCSMLHDAIHNAQFRELFLVQVSANNEDCEDRAAMAFNELFTSWKVAACHHDSPLKDKLAIMAAGARTIALRAEITRLIAAHEKETLDQATDEIKHLIANLKEAIVACQDPDQKSKLEKDLNKILERFKEHESVEIFLFYETALKQTLNLLTAIEKMNYAEIGERSWIKPDDLNTKVRDTYLDHLIQLDVFKQLISQDQTFQTQWELIADQFVEATTQKTQELDALKQVAKPTSEADQEALNHRILICEAALGEIKVARELAYVRTAKAWFQQQA